MTVSVYTLQIREDEGAGSTEVRIVAASLTEAVARAEMRFGPGRIASITQAEPDAADLAGAEADVDTPQSPKAIDDPIVADDFIVARAPESLPDIEAEVPADAVAHPLRAPADYAFAADALPPDPPPGEGRWRPSVLLWSGAIAGLVAFALWVNFGTAPRDRFIVADRDTATPQSGLPIDGSLPAGGVLQATGVTLRRGSSDAMLADPAGETDPNETNYDGESRPDGYDTAGDDDRDDDNAVQAIGTLVGDLFSRYPADNPAARAPPPPPPMQMPATPDEARADDRWPDPRIAAPAPEPAPLRRWYIEVQRADRVTETLAVNATDADQARAIIFDRPDHPVIVHGPSTDLTW